MAGSGLRNAWSLCQARYRTLCLWAVIHRLIEFLVSDLVEATKVRLVESQVQSVADVRQCRERLVIASPTIAAQKEELEKFLYNRVYRHPNVLAENPAVASGA